MKKFYKIVTIVVMIVCAITLVGCKKTEGNNSIEELVVVAPKLSSIISAEEQSVIDVALSSEDGDTLKEAAILMYNIANRSRIETKLSLMVQNCVTSASVGSIYMRGFTLRSDNSFYYQLPSQCLTDKGATMDMFNIMQVSFTEDMQTYFYGMAMGAKAGSPDCASIENFPYSKLGKTPKLKMGEYDAEGFKGARFTLVSQLEIINMQFCEEALASASIQYNEQEKFYTVKFAIDCSDSAKEKDAYKNFCRLPNLEVDSSGMTKGCKRDYAKYEATFTLWDSGYARSYVSNESWKLSGGSSIVSGILGESSPTVSFLYFYDEKQIEELLRQDIKNAMPSSYISSKIAEYKNK